MTIYFKPPSADVIPITETSNTIYLRTEADLPNQTATTWTMDAFVPYFLAGDITTVKQCIPAQGCSLYSHSMDGYVLTYTGVADDMFLGVDVDFDLHDIGLDAGITKTCLNFSDTVGGVYSFRGDSIRIYNADIVCQFDDMALAQLSNSNCRNFNIRGIKLLGDATGAPKIWSFTQIAFISTNAAAKVVDLGTAQALVQEFQDLLCFCPAGAIGFSGLINSGNVPVGRLMTIRNCEFLGGMDDLENLSVVDDARVSFEGNSPTADTQPDALISFTGNALETVISTVNTPVKINAVWSDAKTPSLFSTDSSGSVTSLSERPINAPIDITLGLISVGGGSKDVTVYLYVNGIQDIASGVQLEVTGGRPESISIPWQKRLILGDVIEVWVENNSNTGNLVVFNGVLRLL